MADRSGSPRAYNEQAVAGGPPDTTSYRAKTAGPTGCPPTVCSNAAELVGQTVALPTSISDALESSLMPMEVVVPRPTPLVASVPPKPPDDDSSVTTLEDTPSAFQMMDV